ncbi:energy transducer TonB [Polluticoccus soli]|uniref:energy transducer TonB n=1 Tax=Polluticoccus soli TaxID=3034150 RepID=UPI0023E216CC|nr:energy transducer TonB [Flavipsychrobacter sp. JY13-12]
MELQAFLTADYLDIVFDNRNKQYGGYVLRKTYHKRVFTSLTFILFATGAFSVYALVNNDAPVRNVPVLISCPIGPTLYEPPKSTPKPPAAPTGAPKTDMVKFTTPVIVENDVVEESPTDLSTKVAGPINTNGKEGTVSIVGDSDTASAPVADTKPVLPEAPIKFAEVMPEFNGDLNDYLGRKLMYPTVARENSIEGTVIVQFVVAEDGSVSNAKVLRSLAGGCSEEALRVVNSMPKWKPGKQNGQPVKVFYTLPIRFVLQ